MRVAIVFAIMLAAAPCLAGGSCPENTIWAGCWDAVGLPSTNASLN